MTKHFACILVVTALVIQFQGNAQVLSTIQPGSTLWLDGNSTLHKYSSKASEFTGSIRIDTTFFSADTRNLSSVFQEARLNIPVKKMVSGDEKLDDNMYEALNADDHPEISFRLLRDSIVSFSRDSMKLSAKGMLSVSGKDKEIAMTLMLIQSSADTLTIEGSKELLMSEFGIDPPSMMLGLLKTDDKIVIHFQLYILPQRSGKEGN